MYVIDEARKPRPENFVSYLKFGFSGKATKFEKNLRRTYGKSVVFRCAQQHTCQKVDQDFLKQMWPSHIIQNLIDEGG